MNVRDLSDKLKIPLIISVVLWALCLFRDQWASLMPGLDIVMIQRILLLVILLMILVRRVLGARRQKIEAEGKE